MKIYVITKGYYSDYHICTVTEDKDKADILVKRFTDSWGDARIEEYDTDICVRYIHNNVYFCKHREGAEITISLSDLDYVDDYALSVNEAKNGALFTRVFARDEEHALKIAIDKFAKYKAEKMGL